MKLKLIITVLTLSSTIIFNQTSFAQSLNNTFAQKVFLNKTIEYTATINNFSGKDHRYVLNTDIEKSAGTVKMSKSAVYMISEQFVFDNLSSLKKTFSISDIYFDLDDAGIRADAIPVLDGLVQLMVENPGLSVATTAYSDSRMNKYNEKLALSRAQAANDYLISKGISADRIQIEKHGRPSLANPCNNDPACSLAVQQLNRRTEFNIIYNGINLAQIN